LTNPPHTFEVVAARSGTRRVVGEDDTIANVLIAAGVTVKLGCQAGGCGTCIQTILEGTAEHHDVYLTEAERRAGRVLICCARSLTDVLVLDL